MMTIPDLVDRLGMTELASDLGHTNVTTVASWKYRRRIPVGHWARIVAFAARKGVALSNDDLVAMHVKDLRAGASGDAA